MDIKKADSKGRVTGFSPNTTYRVEVSESGRITATPITDWDRILRIAAEGAS